CAVSCEASTRGPTQATCRRWRTPAPWPPSRRLEAEDPVSLHRQLHQVDRRDERRVLSEHLLRDPTGLGAAFSNVEANLLRCALAEEVGKGRDPDSANAGADLGLEQVDRVARERDRDFDVGRPSAVGGDVERDAGTSRVGGLGPSTPVLFAATLLMGLGVAVSQPALPALVRDWFPTRIILATAVLSNGMLCGETIPTIFTTPFGVLPLAGGDWRWALASWSVIVGASALGLVAVAPRHRPSLSMPRRCWPSWRENQVVRIGAVMGM